MLSVKENSNIKAIEEILYRNKTGNYTIHPMRILAYIIVTQGKAPSIQLSWKSNQWMKDNFTEVQFKRSIAFLKQVDILQKLLSKKEPIYKVNFRFLSAILVPSLDLSALLKIKDFFIVRKKKLKTKKLKSKNNTPTSAVQLLLSNSAAFPLEAAGTATISKKSSASTPSPAISAITRFPFFNSKRKTLKTPTLKTPTLKTPTLKTPTLNNFPLAPIATPLLFGKKRILEGDKGGGITKGRGTKGEEGSRSTPTRRLGEESSKLSSKTLAKLVKERKTRSPRVRKDSIRKYDEYRFNPSENPKLCSWQRRETKDWRSIDFLGFYIFLYKEQTGFENISLQDLQAYAKVKKMIRLLLQSWFNNDRELMRRYLDWAVKHFTHRMGEQHSPSIGTLLNPYKTRWVYDLFVKNQTKKGKRGKDSEWASENKWRT